MEDSCIFCRIIKGEIPSYKIYEDEDVYAFLDIADDAMGHTLVIPKKHYENILDVTDNELKKVMLAVKKIANHFVDNCGFSGVNILNANGKDAQQTVFHLHFHIIPRYQNDGLNTWPELTKKNNNMENVHDRLKMY